MPPTENATAGPGEAVPDYFRKGARPSWHQHRRHRAVLSLLQSLTGRVLDYGCGYGDLTHAMAQTHEVVGCDVDPARVAFARREYAPIEFVECRPEGVPFGDESFDVVVSSVVIHFVPDPAHYLREVRRLLRPDGHLVIACKNEPALRNALRRLLGKGRAPARLWVPPREKMRKFIEDAGFEVVGSTYFYDPPFEGWRNPRDWVFGALEQVLSTLRVRPTAGYHVYLTRVVGR